MPPKLSRETQGKPLLHKFKQQRERFYSGSGADPFEWDITITNRQIESRFIRVKSSQ